MIVAEDGKNYNKIKIYVSKQDDNPIGEAEVNQWSHWIYDNYRINGKITKLNIAYRFDNLNIIEEVVAGGTCIAFVPKFMMDYYKGASSINTLLVNDANLEIEIIMVRNKRHRVSNIEKELINTIKSLCLMCEFHD